MKKTYIQFGGLFLISLIFNKDLFTQANSDILYQSGTSVEVQTGAGICADEIIINGSWSGGGNICGGTLPVIISAFNSSVKNRNVILSWVTETELNNAGFYIEIQNIDNNSGWEKIGFVKGGGTTSEKKYYSFIDSSLNTGSYLYRLNQMDYNGNYEYFSLNDRVIIKPPGKFSMGQNYPNPGNPGCRINYEIPYDGLVTIKVYDVLGKEVKILVNGIMKADYYTVVFDGSGISSGTYFYKIDFLGSDVKFTKTLKMLLVK